MNFFIIGSGFTKSIFPEAPLNNELLRAIANGKLDCASQYLMEKYQTDDIEIALTKLDADKQHCRPVNFVFDEWYFPKSAKNTHFGYGLGRGEIYLIAPSYVKVPTVEITYFMIDALKAASESQNLIIIGCSLRPEDSFLTLLLTHFLRQSQWQSRKIVILDIKANDIASRVKDYWGVNIEECVVPIEGRIENSVEELRKAIKK